METTREQLAQQISARSRLTGHFVLRSGTTATEYFDKYLFESDPTHELRKLGATVTDAVCIIDRKSRGTEALAAEGVALAPLFRMSELPQ